MPLYRPTQVCLAYLNELVVLSNGDVTSCCLDGKGVNAFGNINDASLGKIWQERVVPWHGGNVEASRGGGEWKSGLCRMCLEVGYMASFNAIRTSDPVLIERFQKPFPPFPKSLVIEPSSLCNYSCRGCVTGLKQHGRRGFLDMEGLRRNILPFIPKIGQIRLYNYGEPFLHPLIKEMISALRHAGPRSILHISTNAMRMDEAISRTLVESKVNYLVVSMHGGHTREGLLKYSIGGPNIEVIRANIERLVAIKRENGSKLPWICAKAILFDWNDSEEEMAGFLDFGRGVGADLTGWALNNSDPAFSSKRVAPGTGPYQRLVDEKLLERCFYEFPAWPPEEE